MNKTEQAVLKSLAKNLDNAHGVYGDDTWETMANRMKTTCKNSVSMINELLKIEPSDADEPEITLE
jgi:hypothetical protein